MRLPTALTAALLVLSTNALAGEREIKTADGSNENRAAACASANSQLQNDIGVRLGTQKLVSLSSCDCSKTPDTEYSKGRWTCIANGTFESKN